MNKPQKIPPIVSNWMKYHNFLKKQDALLGDIFKHYQGKKARYEYERVLIGLLHRYALNFRSVYHCWNDFLQNHHYKFSIYSLLRPLLADYILMLYLLEEFKFIIPTDSRDKAEEWQIKEDDFIKRYENISATFFERMDSLLKKKVKNNEMTAQEMQEFLKHHQQEFPEYFPQGPNPQVVKNRGLTPGQMVGEIVNGKQFVKDIYDYYFKLSQFEHFTLITEQLIKNTEHNAEMMYVVDVTNYL